MRFEEKSWIFSLRTWATNFARRECQSATVEIFVVVLGLIVSSVCVGVCVGVASVAIVANQRDFGFASAERQILTAGTDHDVARSPGSHQRTESHGTEASWIFPDAPLAGMLGWCLVGGLNSVVLACAAFYVVRRLTGWPGGTPLRRSRAHQGEQSIEELKPTAASLPAHLLTRLRTKRQEILDRLGEDKMILLEGKMKVRHIMTRDLMVVSLETAVHELKSLMKQNTVRHLLVCGDDNQLLGIISNRDLLSRSGTTAKEVMNPNPVTVSSERPVGAAVTLFLHKGFSGLPVVDEGTLCGVITTTDLIMTMQCALQLLQQLARDLPRDSCESVASREPTTTSELCETTCECD